jgi:hypothetical protein
MDIDEPLAKPRNEQRSRDIDAQFSASYLKMGNVSVIVMHARW